MGNKISSVTAIAGIDSYVSELDDIHYEKSIGNARFMKTIRGRHKDGLVVVKILVKPEFGLLLQSYVKRLQEEYDLLLSVPNAFPFQKILETDRAAYLVRQYFYSSVYDRISTRPFLTLVEKKWIAYQLLRCIADAHARGVCHGDIKTENILVTSWNWVYVVDFASYKPTYLPEDDPADYSFFFDTSSRRSCYIAPERFYKGGSDIDKRMRKLSLGTFHSELTCAMDIFSVGCVIAELFLEGTPMFSLSQLFKYRSGEYSPEATLDKIEDVHVRDMVRHMIQMEPDLRNSAEEYMDKWRGNVFPDYFYNFFHQYMCTLADKGQLNQQKSLTFEDVFLSKLSNVLPGSRHGSGDADKKMDRIYVDFDSIVNVISSSHSPSTLDSKAEHNSTTTTIAFPPTLNIPKYEPKATQSESSHDGGALIFLSFVCSLVRNVTYPSSKLKALDVLLALSKDLPDDIKLDRLVPYLMILLKDRAAIVRANAIKTLVEVLDMVESISPINARIFLEYIMPTVREFATDHDVLVRTTYAGCIALLAETTLRFLEMTQLLKAENTYPVSDAEAEVLDFDGAYETSRDEILSMIQEQVTTLLIDSESSVKRALLTNTTFLCVFFGRQKANDVLLSHMITYLNDKDWMLRCAFFESIKGVGTFVGAQSLEEYILPLMVQTLTDPEEFVVEKVLNSLTSLADLGLFQKMKLWELAGVVAQLLCHPSIWVRNGAVGFITAASKHLPESDLWCIIYPLLTPFLKSDIADINEMTLLENLMDPVPRQVFEQTIAWARKATHRSLFWMAQQEKPSKSRKSSGKSMSVDQGSSMKHGSLFGNIMSDEQLSESSEDKEYFDRLRSIGMTDEDKEKLAHMRDYIFKVSRAKSRPKAMDEVTIENGEIFLKNLGVTPLTVFLPDMTQAGFLEKSKSTSKRKSLNDTELRSQGSRSTPLQNSMAQSQSTKQIRDAVVSASNTQDNVTHSNSTERQQVSTQRGSTHFQDTCTDSGKSSEPSSRLSSKDQIPEAGQQKLVAGYEHLYRLLYNTALETFSPHMPDIIGDPSAVRRSRRQGVSSFRSMTYWKPEGTLIAHFTEHTSGINQLAISWDSLFFASCSDDGTVKIWDCTRLEKNVTNRSVATYSQQGGRIKCITFIQKSYTIAAASDNGSIHVFRVDFRSSGPSLKIEKCVLVRKYQLEDEAAIIIEHFTSNVSNTMAGSKSILLFATTKSRIYALDLLTMTVIWKFQNPKSHGVITSMVTDQMRTWVLVGTSRGILTLYDLRFQIPVRSWTHPRKSRVSAMMINPDPRAEGRQVIIAAGKMEWSVWDIVKLQCLEVYTIKSGDDKPVGTSYKALPTPTDDDILANCFTDEEANVTENSIRALSTASDCRFVVAGGADRKLRFWDMSRIEYSGVTLGLELDEPKPRYSTITFDQIKFNFEFTQANRRNTASAFTTRSKTAHGTTGSASNIVSQQQYLLRNHTNVITGIVLTEIPYPMVISGDRDGVIKVIS